ncbi:MAG: aldose epimerase family protein [Parabacteroides sp.]
MKKICMAVMAICMLVACGNKKQDSQAVEKEATTLSGLKSENFVAEVDGKPTALYVMTNKQGAEVCMTNWGGRIVSIMVPDKNGKMTDVVLGYDNIQDYVAKPDNNYGAFIGRYGNRIAQGKFTLDGTEYELPHNDNGHCLHGGPKGYHAVTWDINQTAPNQLVLSGVSPDGEAGFPGNLNIKVTYTWTDDNALDIQYEATTDKPTIVNLTNHSYFNLSGDHSQQILDHVLMINADNYTPVDELLIPTAEIAPVEGTPLDFRTPTAIGERIDEAFEQLQRGRGYDHNWVLNTAGDITKQACAVYSPKTGIQLEVYTNEPGVQCYTGNFMSGDDKGKGGIVYPHRGAICLETQHYPDSPNKPTFPSVVLNPGETYKSECIYKFTIK